LKNLISNDYPVCANKEWNHFPDGAATPPVPGGEFRCHSRVSSTPFEQPRKMSKLQFEMNWAKAKRRFGQFVNA